VNVAITNTNNTTTSRSEAVPKITPIIKPTAKISPVKGVTVVKGANLQQHKNTTVKGNKK